MTDSTVTAHTDPEWGRYVRVVVDSEHPQTYALLDEETALIPRSAPQYVLTALDEHDYEVTYGRALDVDD